MKNIVSLAAGVCLVLAALACGKKGGIDPPLVLVPQKVENLKAVQRGRHILLGWSNPESYIDGRPLSGVSAVEIWVLGAGPSGKPDQKPPTAEEFEAKSRLLAVVEQTELPSRTVQEAKTKPNKKAGAAGPKKKAPLAKEQLYEYPLADEDLKEPKLTFAVRVREEKKSHFSDFSGFAAISPQPLPLPPTNIRTQVFEDRVEIRWDAPQANFDQSGPVRLKGFNVYRIDAGDKLQRLNSSLVREEKYSDTTILFGPSYRYFVRAAATDAAPLLESDNSDPVDVTPKDVFPPAAPLNPAAAKGPNFITLIWDAGREKDLAGYKVWRREAGQDAFLCLTAQPIAENTFSDSSVEKNKRYEYAITALDNSGNESPKSEIVSEGIKGDRS